MSKNGHNPKRDALERYRKAFTAYENGLVTRGELDMVEYEVLQAEGVSRKHLEEIRTSIRDNHTRNSDRGGKAVATK